MKRILILAAIAATFGIASACSSQTETTTTTNTNAANKTTTTTANTTTNSTTANAPASSNANTADEAPPESVKAIFPDAGNFKREHKNMTPTQIDEITKTAGVKPPDTDHHYFAAFSGGSGARKQIGAATTIKADGKDIIVVYENKEGKPFIKEVRAEGVPSAFLAQFAGKSHDDKMQIGTDLKANGADDKTAKAIADAVRVDAVTMQILYGAKDSH